MDARTINAMISAYEALIFIQGMPYSTPEDGDTLNYINHRHAIHTLAAELKEKMPHSLGYVELSRLAVAVPVWPGARYVTDLDQLASRALETRRASDG